MIYHITNVFFYGKLLITIQLLWINIDFVYRTQEKNIDYEKALAKYEEDKNKAYEEYKKNKEQEWNDFQEEELASAQEKYFRWIYTYNNRFRIYHSFPSLLRNMNQLMKQ